MDYFKEYNKTHKEQINANTKYRYHTDEDFRRRRREAYKKYYNNNKELFHERYLIRKNKGE